jgi:hypothetical protein
MFIGERRVVYCPLGPVARLTLRARSVLTA